MTQQPPAVPHAVKYSDDLEQTQPHELEIQRKLTSMMRDFSQAQVDKYRHATRSVHSKSHGVVVGELEVLPDLPDELAQGLFARPGRYPALLRFSSTPGDILSDSVSTPRALSLKIIGPEGAEMVEGHGGERTQDFVMINAPSFGMKDAQAFLKSNLPIRLTLNAPEPVKVAASLGARAAVVVLDALGKQAPPPLKKMGGHPHTHPLGDTYYTQVPLRWGDYVGKVAVAPAGDLARLKDQHVHVVGNPHGLRDAISRAVGNLGGEWEVRVQLCTNPQDMPIEDALVEWSEQDSPYLTVARIHAEPQDSYRPDKQVYADDRASFDPWHAWAAHRPLGNVMRARRDAYRMSREFRRLHNDEAITEPRGAGDLPPA